MTTKTSIIVSDNSHDCNGELIMHESVICNYYGL